MCAAPQIRMHSMTDFLAGDSSGIADNPFVSARSKAKNERVKRKD